ncbi:MAG: ROK family protein [Candidatus Limnocylindrales bacterium]
MALRHTAMLEVNEFLVLDFIRECQETTRPDIAHALGLSASSVSRLVARLIREGMVRETGATSTSSGRPRGCIAFNHLAGCVVAVDLGGTRCHGALADLAGEILAEDERPNRAAGEAFATVLAIIADLRRAAAEREMPVAAVAVGVPAIIDPVSGRALAGPRVDWQDFEVVRGLDEAIDVPVLVDNDVNLAALAHAWRGEARGVDDFVTVSIGTGIGGAVVADGRLVKGHHNAGGEVGYITTDRVQLDETIERGLGGFEALASAPALARRAEDLLAGAGRSGAWGPGEVTAERVFSAATAGDEIAKSVVDEAVDALALVLTAVVATVDPALVVLDGSVGRSLEPFLPAIRERLARRLPVLPTVVVSRMPAATVVGAIAAALQLARERRAPGALSGALRAGSWPATGVRGLGPVFATGTTTWTAAHRATGGSSRG